MAIADQIAIAGSTGQSFDVSVDSSQVVLAMETIRGSTLDCKFDLPSPSNGGAPAPEATIVTLTTPEGLTGEIEQVPSAADCGNPLAWYLADPANATSVILCPAACDAAHLYGTDSVTIAVACLPT